MNKASRLVTGIAVGSLVGLGALALAADKPAPTGPTAAQTPPDRAPMREEMVRRHLDRVAARLEIKASQQSAWQAYADAVKAAWTPDATPPAADADAATIARHRAETVTALGRKLSAVADATARLQSVLSADQKRVFDEIARTMGRHRGEGGPGAPMMERHHGDRDQARGRGRGEGGWTAPLAPRNDAGSSNSSN